MSFAKHAQASRIMSNVSKGTYVKSISMSSTMSPGIAIETNVE